MSGCVYPQNKEEPLGVGETVPRQTLQEFIVQPQGAGLPERNDFFIFSIAGNPMLVQELMEKENNRLKWAVTSEPTGILAAFIVSKFLSLFQQS